MPKEFYLSVNKTKIKQKEQGQFITGFSLRKFDLESSDDVKVLNELFQTNCYNNNQWTNPKAKDQAQGYDGSCSRQNYVGMHGIILDIDEPGLSLDQAKEKFKDYVYLIHTSSSHQVNVPEKGGAIDRFRIILPFAPGTDGAPHYSNKIDAERLYDFLKNKFSESDSVVFGIDRKYYPFAGKDRSRYQFFHNANGKFISFNQKNIEASVNKPQNNVPLQKKKPVQQKVDSFVGKNDKIKEHVTTLEPYYSPTGDEYVMPDELISVNVDGTWEQRKFQEIKEYMLLKGIQKIPVYCNHCDDKNSQSASAFIYRDLHGFFNLECSHCKDQLEKKQMRIHQ